MSHKAPLYIPSQFAIEQISVPRYLKDKKLTWLSMAIWIGLLALVIVVLGIVGQFLTNGLYLSGRNISNLFSQSSYFVLAVPIMLLIWSRGSVDLSVGGNMLLGAALFGLGLESGLPLLVAMVLATLASLVTGLISAALIGFARWSGLLVTVIMVTLIKSFGVLILQSNSLVIESNQFPMVALAWIIAFVGTAIMLVQFFRVSTPEAKASSWLKQSLWRGSPFVLSAMAAAVMGIFLSLRLSSVNPSLGSGIELDMIIVLALSGTAFGGRKANVIAAILAVLVLSLLSNLLSLTNASYFLQYSLKAGIALLALGISATMHLVLAYIDRQKTSPEA